MPNQHREVIDHFTGPYAFLSNFQPCRVTFYAKGETLEEHLHREGLSQSYCYPISTFACMGDEGWLESGEMGWFGISDNNKDDLSWNQMVEQFVAALPEDAMLLSVDCHI